MSLTTIPTDFGSGGANLNPTGNTPTLRTVLDEHKTAIEALQAGSGTNLNACRVVAVSNITLSGAQTIDGVAVAAPDRVLVTGQSTPSQNGPYVVAAGAWTRATDFDAAPEMLPGIVISVYAGTIYQGTVWQFTTTGAITVGSTTLTFTQVGPATFGSNVSVPLTNSASAPVTALQLIASLTTATAGVEVSKWLVKVLSGGAQVDGLSVEDTQLGGRHRFYFLDDTDTYIENGSANRLDFVAGGVLLATFNAVGFTLNAGAGVNAMFFGGGSEVNYNGAGSLVLTPGNRHVQIGAAGALATSAVGGFPTIPTCAGTPTGVPANLAAGHAPYIIDTTAGKFWAFYGAAWHFATLT